MARLAGVSSATVSIVLSGRTDTTIRISPETRARVVQAAESLGFMPNPAAQMLAQGRSRLIALFYFGDTFPYEREHQFYLSLLGIEREASRQDYNVLLITRGQSAEKRSIYAAGGNMLRLADGAILMGPLESPDELARLVEDGYPFIYIGRRQVPGYEIDWVVSDYIQAGYEGARHVLGLGHRRLGFVWNDSRTEEVRDRQRGIERAAAEVAGAELVAMPQGILTDAAQMERALRESGISALLCAGQASVRASLTRLDELGVRVPADLSVVALSFDEGRQWPWPALRPTHVRHPESLVGERAVQALIARLDGTVEGPQHWRIPCEFVIGNSTAPR